MAGAKQVPPLVSIGLPVYNGEAFIAEAIETLLAQSFQDMELIVSDNASTDSTGDVVRGLAARDSRIRYVRQPRNLGAAANFNAAFAESTGRYFKWAAHDDYVAGEFLQQCVDVLNADEQVVLVYANALDVDHEGAEIGPVYDTETDLRGDAGDVVERYHHFVLENHSCISIFGLIRRDVLERTPLIDKYVGSDRVLLAELALHGKLIKLPGFMMFHREYEGRSTRTEPDLQERIGWFDPDKAGSKTFPHWRLLRAYSSAVFRTGIDARTAVRCHAVILRWIRWGNWRLLWSDLTYYPRQGRPCACPADAE